MAIRAFKIILLGCVLMVISHSGGCSQTPEGNGAKSPVRVFGLGGTGPGEFMFPRAIAASKDRLYIADKSGRIQCFDHRGQFLFQWSMPKYDLGKPVGLYVAKDGRLFVPDTHYSRVMIFDHDGQLLNQFGSRGTGPGQFHLPTDIAIDSKGFIYVGEYGENDRISKFTPNFEYLFSFAQKGVNEPYVLRPQSLLIAPDDTLWVADMINHRLLHFNENGKLLGTIGEVGVDLGQLRYPYGLDMMSDGTLVVTDFKNSRVQRFSTDGKSLGVWGIPGREPGELASPWALAVIENDDIVIVDSGNNRCQVIAGGSEQTWSHGGMSDTP